MQIQDINNTYKNIVLTNYWKIMSESYNQIKKKKKKKKKKVVATPNLLNHQSLISGGVTPTILI